MASSTDGVERRALFLSVRNGTDSSAGWTHHILELYLDDIIVYGTSEDEYVDNLRQVFDRLTKHNVTLNPAKCRFGMEEVGMSTKRSNQQTVLGGLTHHILELYLDDIIVYGTSEDGYIENLRQVFDRLTKHNVTYTEPRKVQVWYGGG